MMFLSNSVKESGISGMDTMLDYRMHDLLMAIMPIFMVTWIINWLMLMSVMTISSTIVGPSVMLATILMMLSWDSLPIMLTQRLTQITMPIVVTVTMINFERSSFLVKVRNEGNFMSILVVHNMSFFSELWRLMACPEVFRFVLVLLMANCRVCELVVVAHDQMMVAVVRVT